MPSTTQTGYEVQSQHFRSGRQEGKEFKVIFSYSVSSRAAQDPGYPASNKQRLEVDPPFFSHTNQCVLLCFELKMSLQAPGCSKGSTCVWTDPEQH